MLLLGKGRHCLTHFLFNKDVDPTYYYKTWQGTIAMLLLTTVQEASVILVLLVGTFQACTQRAQIAPVSLHKTRSVLSWRGNGAFPQIAPAKHTVTRFAFSRTVGKFHVLAQSASVASPAGVQVRGVHITNNDELHKVATLRADAYYEVGHVHTYNHATCGGTLETCIPATEGVACCMWYCGIALMGVGCSCMDCAETYAMVMFATALACSLQV